VKKSQKKKPCVFLCLCLFLRSETSCVGRDRARQSQTRSLPPCLSPVVLGETERDRVKLALSLPVCRSLSSLLLSLLSSSSFPLYLSLDLVSQRPVLFEEHRRRNLVYFYVYVCFYVYVSRSLPFALTLPVCRSLSLRSLSQDEMTKTRQRHETAYD
jgi:hypothetical protein